MKKLIFLIFVGILLFGGYRYIYAVINFERLSNRIDLIISEPQSKSLDSMSNAILAAAKKLDIPLSKEDIKMTVRDTDRTSIGERFVGRPEIEVESKLLVLSFNYVINVYGIPKTFSYSIEKVFTSKASLRTLMP